jgi:hypothetical protein
MTREKYSNKKPGFRYFALLALLLSMMTSGRLYAQVAGATLSGEVNDTSGAFIPNAQVSIKNVGTGQQRNSVTDAVGFYSVPNLLPGSYEVSVSASGFSTEVRTGITLTVGAQQVFNITMKVGQTSITVEVTGEAPSVQLASSTISGVVNQAAVVELPLNGRDWTSLAYLQPGVEALGSVQANTGSKDRAHRGYGLQMTISGARPQQNSYRIDAINVNDYANGGPGSVQGSALGVDAIQEFSVLTSNYSTEYGRTSGGVVNAITKSGTNQFHGDAYEFLRNSALDARNYFDGPRIPEYRQNQFGAALGGPIWKDKTFFFSDYEGLRVTQGLTTRITVPSQALRNGIVCSIPQPDPGGCATHPLTGSLNPDPVTGIDTAVLPYLALWHLPNAGLLGNGDTGTYSQSGAHIVTENFITTRIDHKFSDSDLIFGSFEFDPATATQPDPTSNVLVSNKTGRSFIAIEETHIFRPQWINTARIGFNRSVHLSKGLTALNPAAADAALGVTPGANNPQLDVPWGPSIQPGLNQVEQLDYWNNSYQGYDDIFVTRGIHSLKFGVAVEKIQLNEYNPAPATEYAFNTYLDFLNNVPSFVLAPVPGIPFPRFGFRSTILAGYLQDDIRLRRNLTINVGMRYEMSTVPTERHGLLSILTSPFNQSLATAHMGNGIFENPTTRNFEPRVGFAWDPFGNGKSSVRGGFGLFDVLPLPYFLGQIVSAAAPFAESGFNSNLAAGDFPTIAFTKAQVSPFRIPYVQQHPGRPYVMQWNLNVQRELIPNLTAMLAYVGSRGVHMPFRSDDINTWQPTLTSAGYLWPNPSNVPAPTTISPNVGQMDVLAFSNDTYFHGLEAQIVKRMSHGVQVQGSYTWSRAIDGGDGSIASDAFLNALPGLFYFLPRYRRGPSDFNVTHNLTVNFIWNIPTPDSLSGPAAWLLRGWQMAGILQVRSGLPFSPIISGDPLGLHNYAPEAFPDIVRGPACKSLVNPGAVAGQASYLNLNCFALPMATPAIAAQCVPFAGQATPGTCSNLLGNAGRNSVYGPGLKNFDYSLIKDTKIKEHLNLQFRAEFFNVFNHSNFQAPINNSAVFASDGSAVNGAGFIDSTSTSNREVQFGLKLIF